MIAREGCEMDEYVALLKQHDWHFAYSDDRRIWLEGKERYDKLLHLRAKLDPKGVTWNEYAPVSFRVAL